MTTGVVGWFGDALSVSDEMTMEDCNWLLTMMCFPMAMDDVMGVGVGADVF